MSGLGIKKWSTGDVLTASDLNGYVGEQIIAVFGTVAARTAAYGGTGEPTLSEGMFSYVIDSDGSGNPAFQYYDGGSWVDVVTAIAPGSITESMLATGAVTADKIANGTIVAAEIANDAVTTDKILDGAVTSAKIANATIVDTDISASAAIAHSKLANATAGQVLLGTTTTGVVTATSLSGDITINGAGVTSIGSGVIVNADINNSASIAYSKLNLNNSIVDGDITTGAVTATKLADTAVTPGTYAIATVTVDAQGRLTFASDGTYTTFDTEQNVLANIIFV